MVKKLYLLVLSILLLLTVPNFAANYGKISGKVVDQETGNPLPSVNVVVEGTALGAATDFEGQYVILQVPPGNYTVVANMIGYRRTRMEAVTVRVNRIAYADFALVPEILGGEELIVVAERPVVEKDITATMRSVNADDIAKLPSTTVNDVLLTQPGVVSSGGLHFRGGRSGEVIYFIDGIPLVQPLFSDINSSEVINRESIAEMQVISGTYSAEYGNSMSGIINITTKEGTSKFRGYLNIKSSKAGFEQNSVDYNRAVLRGSVSGPLLFSKTSFFISANYDDRDNYLPWGYRTEKNVFAKIVDRHIKNLKINLGVNLSDGIHKNYSHRWKYIPDQYWYEPRSNSKLFQLGLTHTLTPKLYYTVNFYYNAYHYDSGDFDYNNLSPAYKLDENKEFYRQSFVSSFEEDDQQTLGVKGDLLWQANNFNEVKAGFEFRQNRIDRFYISSPYYDDHILDDYLKEPREAAAYIQDKINFSSIILSLGLRYDLTDPNSNYWLSPYDAYYNKDISYRKAERHSQLSPRLGISYPVSDKTVFHFGYGHYFQRAEYQHLYKSGADENYKQNMIMNLRTGNGRFGDANLKPEKTITYEFGLSHQLKTDFLVNVSVYSKKITNLLGTRTFFAGSRADIWETYTLYINEDFAYNNGLEIQLRKIRGRNLFGEINYTYAVAEGSSSGPLERVGIEEANRQTLKFFPLDFDQRHTVNFNLTFQLNPKEGPYLGGIYWLENFRSTLLFRNGSGLPYSKGIRGATEPYEVNNGRLPANWFIDLKAEREFSLGAVELVPYLEIYNLTNRKNVVYVDPYTGKPDFSYGRTYEYAANPLNWGAPRIIYLGLILNFKPE